MCELLIGLPAVTLIGIDDGDGGPLMVHVETRADRPGCSRCGSLAAVKDRPIVTLVDLPAFGRPTRLLWHKRRWACVDPDCGAGSWTEDEPRIGFSRMLISDRAGRWVTEQVGRCARSVAEVAKELGCDSQTVNAWLIGRGAVQTAGLTRVVTDAFGLSFARSVIRPSSGRRPIGCDLIGASLYVVAVLSAQPESPLVAWKETRKGCRD